MKGRKSYAVMIFIGALLIVIFAVGAVCSKDPGAFLNRYRYDFTLEQFCAFCANWYIPAGIVGIPLFLLFLVLSLREESKEGKEKQ